MSRVFLKHCRYGSNEGDAIAQVDPKKMFGKKKKGDAKK